jgi:hypothetical protein
MAILKADPAYRRRMIVLSVASVVIASCVVLWGPALLDKYLDEYVRAGDFSGAVRFIQISTALLILPTFPMVYCLYRFGRRVLASGQFPPPGTKVPRDTVIIEGAQARRRGRAWIGVSIALALIALVSVVYLPYLLGKLGEGVGPPRGSQSR